MASNARYPDAVRVEKLDGVDRESWEIMRTAGLGGSDIPQVMGLSPWGGPLRVWRGKVWPEQRERVDNAGVEWGTRLEPVIRDAFRAKHPELQVEQVHALLSSKLEGWGWCRANLDGVVRDPARGWGVLEIKTANAYSGAAGWLEGVPAYYRAQVDWYFFVTGLRFAWVVVLVGGSDYREYLLEWSAERQRVMLEAADEFWAHVEDAKQALQDGVEPAEIRKLHAPLAARADAELVGELWGVRPELEELDLAEQDGDTVQLVAGLLRDHSAAKQAATEAERVLYPYKQEAEAQREKMQQIEAQLQQLAGGAARAVFGSTLLYTSKLQKGRASFKPTLLKDKYPAIYDELATKNPDSYKLEFCL